MPLSGGAIKPLITGFAAPIVGLAANGRYIYVGELTGQLFRVKVWSVRGGMTNVAAPTPPICIGLLLAGCSEPIGGVYET